MVGGSHIHIICIDARNVCRAFPMQKLELLVYMVMLTIIDYLIIWSEFAGELQHSFSLYTAVQSDILHLPPSISPPFGCLLLIIPPFGCLLLIIPSPCMSHHTSPV